MRFALLGVHYSNSHRKMNRIYLAKNPWELDSPWEHCRFTETNRVISDNYGKVGSILEIGCGEGHQTAYLMKACECLIGLDVSDRAVERARKQCPSASFIVGDIFSKAVERLAPYDLVVACEVLYYMNDIPDVLRRIQSLGNSFLLTYFSREMKNLDSFVLSSPGIASEIIKCQDLRWRIAWGPSLST